MYAVQKISMNIATRGLRTPVKNEAIATYKYNLPSTEVGLVIASTNMYSAKNIPDINTMIRVIDKFCMAGGGYDYSVSERICASSVSIQH